MDNSQFKPGVVVIILIALGILICVLAFIIIKRQIMRFALKYPTDGPHAPIGHDAPKKLHHEIERRLNLVKHIQFEPLLVNPDNVFSSEANLNIYKHIYRMKAVDLLKELEDEIVNACGNDESIRRLPGQDVRVYLLNLRKDNFVLSNCESKLINEFVECYTNARCDPIPEFGLEEYKHYQSLFNSIKSAIIPITSSNTIPTLIHRKTSKNSNTSQTATLKSVASSPSKIQFQTQVVQDIKSKLKDSETTV